MQEIVHQKVDNLWYFWDEIWTSTKGPYNTKKEAEEASEEYYRDELEL